jgi:hypothetical protein
MEKSWAWWCIPVISESGKHYMGGAWSRLVGENVRIFLKNNQRDSKMAARGRKQKASLL